MMNVKDRSVFLVVLLASFVIARVSGYGSAKEGICPPPPNNPNCAARIFRLDQSICQQDLGCDGTMKCCDDGCMGRECVQAINLPVVPKIDPCPNFGETLDETCEQKNVTLCDPTDCKQCCSHVSTCSPVPGYIEKEECGKQMCQKNPCIGQGQVCTMDKYHRAKCVCQKCPENPTSAPVCGSDQVTYPNRCEMNITACVLSDIITVVHDGQCRVSTTPPTPYPEFTTVPAEVPLTKEDCSLPKDSGFNSKGIAPKIQLRYYFNKAKGICEGFVYHGTGGNKNNFDTFKACRDFCEDTIKDPCALPKLVGPCRAAFRRWYSNENRKCEKFTFGGCSGNANNFKTRDECRAKCAPAAPPQDMCSLKKSRGTSTGFHLRWYYSTKSLRCKIFVYHGGQGNGNRFGTRRECERSCVLNYDEIVIPRCLGPNKFNCRSIKKCIPNTLKCDGNNDCPDGSDEENCDTPDPCAEHKCEFYGNCATTLDGHPFCACPLLCTADYNPVCGSDGQTYPNLCAMKVKSCKKAFVITVDHEGACGERPTTEKPFDICDISLCEFGKCVNVNGTADCRCQLACPFIFAPICGNNGTHNKTYSNSCVMDAEGCEQKRRIKIVNEGPCAEDVKSKCQQEFEALPSPIPPGTFVPQCKEDGSYHEVQCHGSTGYCWCVDEQGTKLEETEIKFDRPNCTERTKCQKERSKVLRRIKETPGLVGYFLPKCEDNGDYKNVQCHGSTGYCWCVDEQGTELEGTSIRSDKPNCGVNTIVIPRCLGPNKFNCRSIKKCIPDTLKCDGNNDCPDGSDEENCERTKCQKERSEVLRRIKETPGLVGYLLAECEDNGDYKKVQCHGSTGYCWCVDEQGTKLEETAVQFSRPNCTERTKCQKERSKGLRRIKETPGLVGHFVAECEDNGDYKNVQCHGSTGYCWCVDEEGTELEGTAIRSDKPNCGEATQPFDVCDISLCDFGRCVNVNGTADCQCQLACTLNLEPVCGNNGTHEESYPNMCVLEAVACEQKTRITVVNEGHCLPKEKTKCEIEVELATKKDLVGNFVPQCKDDGSYHNMQCWSSTGYCWCADSQGKKLEETEIRFKHPNCSFLDERTKCQNERAAIDKAAKPGTFVPQCKEDGSYHEVQCQGSTGYCWCVDEQGTKLEETAIAFKRPNCGAPNQSPADDICAFTLCASGVCVNVNGTAECQCRRGCPRIYAPVCGTNGKTYPNLCSLNVEACENNQQIFVKHDGVCEPSLKFSSPLSTIAETVKVSDACDNTLCLTGTCVDVKGVAQCQCNKICTKIYQPVCGTNEKNYANLCLLKVDACETKQRIFVKNEGKCGGDEIAPSRKRSKCELEQDNWNTELQDGFIPECNKDGSYKTVQCDGFTGFCFCVDENGKALEDSGVRFGRPDCSGGDEIAPSRKRSKCELEQDNWNTELQDGFIPECNEDGSYKTVQCGGFTGFCFCVDENGKALKDSGVRFGRPDCSVPKEKTKCEIAAELATKKGLVGNFVPQCKDDGSYHNMQCWSSTGYCWCADNHGNKLEETEVQFKQPNCSFLDETTKCQNERAAIDKAAKPGTFVPQCKEDGSYHEVQCHGSTGYCWCVDEQGTKLEETAIAFKRPNCGAPNQSPADDICAFTLCASGVCVNVNGTAECQCRRGCPRIYAPVCGTNGKTYPNLCSLNVEACENNQQIFVKHDGVCEPSLKFSSPISTIAETVKVSDACDNTLCLTGTCVDVKGVAQCQCNKICTKIYQPVCGTNEKNYANLCLLKVDACETKQRIFVKNEGKCGGDEITPSRKRSKCELEQDNWNTELQDGFIPECNEDGSYKTVQCDGFTGFCFCVDEIGKALEDSGVRFGRPDCSGDKSKCQKEVAAIGETPPPGKFVPKCKEDGSYVEVQCSGSTGYCWCVDEQGTKLEETAVQFSRPNCGGMYHVPPTVDPEEPTIVDLKEPTIVDLEEPTTVATEEPTTVDPEEPTIVDLEEPTTVDPEEPTIVDLEEPTTVNPEEPTIVDLEEPTTVATEEPTTEEPTTEEPTTVDPEEPTIVDLEEPTTVATEEPLSTHVPVAPVVDPCSTVKCGFHSECVVEGEANTRCVCREACTRELDWQCGSDGKSYSNTCERKKAACLEMKNIVVVKAGKCQCTTCPVTGIKNIAKSFCHYRNSFVIQGEVVKVEPTAAGVDLSVNVTKRFKPHRSKLGKKILKHRDIIKVEIFYPAPGCSCDVIDDVEVGANYVIMGKIRKSTNQLFVKLKLGTAFIQKAEQKVVTTTFKSFLRNGKNRRYCSNVLRRAKNAT